MKILCVGEMLIDFLPGSEPGVYMRKAGGAPANVAIATARQGCSASFLGMMGNDDFGRFLMNTLHENNVKPIITDLTDEAVTTMAIVSLDETGDRSFTFVRKPGADMLLTKEQVKDADIAENVIVHAGSCSLSKGSAAEATAYALHRAHALGKLVSFDVNYRNVMWDDDIAAAGEAVLKVLPDVDILKISEEEAAMIGGEAKLPETMKQYGVTLVIETLGSEGVRCYWNDQVLSMPGLKAKCVDTCGAGDAFLGGFLASLLRSGATTAQDIDAQRILDGMKYGNISGWLCVQKKGAIESLPSAEEVERYRLELYAE